MLPTTQQANASALVGNRLTLLLDDDLDEVAAAAVRLQALLPGITVDKFVEYYPQVLDVDDFEAALQVRVLRGGLRLGVLPWLVALICAHPCRCWGVQFSCHTATPNVYCCRCLFIY